MLKRCMLFTPITWAARFGHAQVCEYLLEQNAPVDKQSAVLFRWGPLHAAAFNGKLDTVKVLLEKSGVKPDLVDFKGRTALQLAQLRAMQTPGMGHEKVVSYLEKQAQKKS